MNILQNSSIVKIINGISNFFKQHKKDKFEIEFKVSGFTAFIGLVKLNKKKSVAHIERFKVHKYFKGKGVESLVLMLIKEQVIRLNRYVTNDDKIVKYITINVNNLDKKFLETLYNAGFNIWGEETALLNIPFKQPDLEEEKNFKLCLIKIL